jgi:hypothetical protein
VHCLSLREDRTWPAPVPCARFDLGEVEYLIDERQEMAAGGEDVVSVLGLFLVKPRQTVFPAKLRRSR